MGESIGQPAKAKSQTIILKEGCWVETRFGVYKIKSEMRAEAIPVFSTGELTGYRFHDFSGEVVTHDLERMVVSDNKENES
jgi:hypothetical protein